MHQFKCKQLYQYGFISNNLDDRLKFEDHEHLTEFIKIATENWTWIDYDSYDHPVHRTHKKQQEDLGNRVRYLSKIC